MGNEGPKKAAARDDAFEASEMHDGARIAFRDKKVTRKMAALLAIPGLLTMILGGYLGVANATASKPVPDAALPFVVAAIVALGLALIGMGVVFGVLRTVVTEAAVHVKYGLWGPTIPLEAIRSCKVVEYDWTEFGGWGIRLGKNGAWAYVPTSGPVVELRYQDGGKEKRVLVGTEDASAVAREINRARERGETRVRVDEETKSETVTHEELEARAEAEEEAVAADEVSKSAR